MKRIRRLLSVLLLVVLGFWLFALSYTVRGQVALAFSPLFASMGHAGNQVKIHAVNMPTSLEPGECTTLRLEVIARPSFDGLSLLQLLFDYRPPQLLLLSCPDWLRARGYPGCPSDGGVTPPAADETEETWETWTGVAQPVRHVTITVYGSTLGYQGQPNNGMLSSQTVRVDVEAGTGVYVDVPVCATAGAFQPNGALVMAASFDGKTDLSWTGLCVVENAPMGCSYHGYDLREWQTYYPDISPAKCDYYVHSEAKCNCLYNAGCAAGDEACVERCLYGAGGETAIVVVTQTSAGGAGSSAVTSTVTTITATQQPQGDSILTLTPTTDVLATAATILRILAGGVWACAAAVALFFRRAAGLG